MNLNDTMMLTSSSTDLLNLTTPTQQPTMILDTNTNTNTNTISRTSFTRPSSTNTNTNDITNPQTNDNEMFLLLAIAGGFFGIVLVAIIIGYSFSKKRQAKRNWNMDVIFRRN